MQEQTITSNPFTHMSNGLKKLWKTNFWNMVIATVAFVVLTIVFMIVMAATILADLATKTLSPNPNEMFKDVGASFLIYLVCVLVYGLTVGVIFQIVSNKLTLSGVENKKMSLAQAVEFAKSRYGIVFKVGLMLVGAYVAFVIVSLLLAQVVPALLILTTLALIVALVLYLPTFMVLPFVLVDEQVPSSPMGVWNRSVELAKKVTVADKKTADLGKLTREADIIVCATGVPGLITKDMVKPDAVVVDAGVATDKNGLVGDVAPDVRELDGIKITPEKGGVGPLTVCALFENVIRAARQAIPPETQS